MDREIRILFIEDVAAEMELATFQLKRAGVRCRMQRVETEQAFIEALRKDAPDVILSDFSLPQFDGISALTLAKARAPETPFIFVSGTIGEERAIEALRLGATDYVLKTNLERLAPALMRALQEAGQRSEKRRVEQQLRDIVETSQDWIWELDAAGEYTFCSPGVREILGVEPAEMIGQSYLMRVSPGDRSNLTEAWRSFATDRRRLSALTARWQHKDGSWRWLERNALALFDPDGKIVGFRGTDRDVTLRKLQDERIVRLNRVQAMLSSVNSVVLRGRERLELLREAARIAVDTGGYSLACVSMVDTGKASVRPFVWKGEHAERTSELAFTLASEAGAVQSLTERAIRTGEPVVCNDLRHEPRLAHPGDQKLAQAFRAMVALPLLVDATAVGALNLYSGEAGAFTDEELSLLRQVAGSISFGLQYLHKEDTVQFLEYFDPLTGLARRSLFCERLARMLAATDGEPHSLVALVLDVERLSTLNDRFGRHTGDRLLQLIAERLKGMIQDTTCLAHFGGGCFAVVFGEVIDSEDAAYVIREQVAHLFDRPFPIEGQEVRASMRSGLARFPGDGKVAEELLQNAEMALKSAKESGEKYLHYVRDMNADLLQRMTLEHKLRQALDEQQYLLYYQPKVSAETGRIVGVEALMRWMDPETGLVAPGSFIPVLEETGLIVEVGKWALEQAIVDGARWQERGAVPVPIAVNVSNMQLKRRDFVETVLRARSLPDCWPIDIEITESALMDDLAGSAQKLNRLREAGIGIAIDDFGTGYSSLARLSKLAVDTLKIDRSFIAGMSSDPADMTIVSTLISLGRSFDLTVVAEGVETHDQLKLLRLLKCHQLQGYLIARPMPADAFGALLIESGGVIAVAAN